ncbi:Glucose/arabinose dehydrogenase, beta-propeller fold [Deinococcus reticulitermitis]|uniref:Glucose/arabinose dehydrogenase, beta-propeller fold n=1 Tax=Deinococcus reticulitermitis TaxID=856736 RepID=A0A1H7BD96_9DEIO|nr:PQQ-dependent sugar dehydrogenase [Deinococcus reticulitermitis]SEJ75621.1 Glucose/arabinose dehydrogenase, beta-propeller fold [Deinococcus reticulitermitis]
MSNTRFRAALVLGAALLLPSALAQSAPAVKFTPVASGLRGVTTLTPANDGSGRMYLTLQAGQVRVLEGGRLRAQPFLDVSRLTSAGGERGLLGLTFDPKYKQNRRLYVHYTDRNGNTVLARYLATADFSRADPASARVLFTAEQPYSNHNGGQIEFGPDGFLYLGLGDGGSGGDPQNNGQKLSSPLGKLLRFDVSGNDAKPAAGNPFIGRSGANPNIWAYGLRNPWRFSFDRQTGDLIIADVGQNAFEEVNRQPRASKGGENYGWKVREGRSCFEPASGCRTQGLTEPVLVYGRGEGQSITGGYVYRGSAIPVLKGQYVFGDFGSGTVWAARMTGNTWSKVKLGEVGGPSAFGQDEAGELYVAEYFTGRVLKLGR